MSHPVYSGDQPQYHFARAQQDKSDIARQITIETKATRRKRQCLDWLVLLLLVLLAILLIVGIGAIAIILRVSY